MNKATKILLTAGLAITTAGAATAQGGAHVCAYVNDNVDTVETGTPNMVEGYKIGPGDATVHIGPNGTNGNGIGGGNFGGGLIAARIKQGDLYASDGASDNITHFTIHKGDCTLVLDTTLYPSGDKSVLAGDGLAITPDGKMMFVASTGDNHISSHTISANGSLGVAFREATVSGSLSGIEVSPDGMTLVVAQPFSAVCAYPISGGHLGEPNCQSTPDLPGDVSIDPTSTCVYVGESNMKAVEVAAFTLTGDILGVPVNFTPFGPGKDSLGVIVSPDNSTIYISNQVSARITTGAIKPGCQLMYTTIINDDHGAGFPGQIAQARKPNGYVVTANPSYSFFDGLRTMGIFHADDNGRLAPIGSGQFPLTGVYNAPMSVVVVGSE